MKEESETLVQSTMHRLTHSLIVLVIAFCFVPALQAQSDEWVSAMPYDSGVQEFDILLLAILDAYALPLLGDGSTVIPIGMVILEDGALGIIQGEAFSALRSRLEAGRHDGQFIATALVAIAQLDVPEDPDPQERIVVFLVHSDGTKIDYNVPFFRSDVGIEYSRGFFTNDEKQVETF